MSSVRENEQAASCASSTEYVRLRIQFDVEKEDRNIDVDTERIERITLLA